MKFLLKKSRIPYLIAGISIFFVLAATPYYLGSGLTQPEPIGAFLNGNFPDVTPTAQPYRQAFPNLTFNSPLTFAHIPNTDVLIVGQRNGEIFWFHNDESITTKNLMADLTDRVGVVWDGGFLGLAVHPNFGTPGYNYIYTYYTSKDSNGNDFPNNFITGFGCNREDYWGNFTYLRRYEVDPVTYTLNPNSELTMIKIRMFSCTHRGGAIDFGDDGFLYITTGDQSAYSKSQNIESNFDGGVLRIDVDQDPTKSHAAIRRLENGRFSDELSGVGYGIPNDNPFLSPSGDIFEEYYSIGHRNPHRLSKDALTGVFYIGEVGENTHEEINVLKKGKNYGWPVFEGYANGPGAYCTTMYNNMPHEGPLVAFPRADANTLMGGFVYRGSEMPEYYGKYICADYGVGEEIWAVDISNGTYELITYFTPTDIISFGQDNENELYLLAQGDNVHLYKMTQIEENPAANAPQLLSQTGAFQDLQTLTPTTGLIPYDLIESFWSDGAEKKRWLAIPNDGTHNTPEEKIVFSENGDWEFPVGSVLVKHFEMPIDENNPALTKRLETRFSVKGSNGHFYFLTYKWNEAQTDAVLLESRVNETIEIAKADGSTYHQTWTYPGVQDCISCHNPATKGTLGPRTRNLNSDFLYPQTSITANQLVTLSYLGILDETIDDNKTQTYQTHKALDDPNATLDEKARSYLDNNCAYCHRPGGTGERAQFDLRLINSLVETGLMYATANTPLGIPGERIVKAGDASKSILFHRTESVDQTIAMPPIAKNEVDQLGVDLIEEWINQLDPNYEDPNIIPSTYTITNVGSGLKMDISGASQANYADVIQWQTHNGTNQQFIVAPAGDNYYTIKAVHSNKNIDVEGQGQAPGTNVIQYQTNGTAAQLFALESLGNNQYAIKSKANNLYLGIQNNSTNNGASVKTYNNDGTDFFKWTFTDLLAVPATGIALYPESATMFIDDIMALTATILPNNASNKGVSWTSADETIATVDVHGRVTAISDGTVIITATTIDGGFTDTTEITVLSNYCNGTIVDHTNPVGSGTILASGELSESENRHKAFDNKKTYNNFSKWVDDSGVPSVSNPSFISIEFDNPQFVNKLVITSANDFSERDPENFRILGSNDGNSFTELATWSGEKFPDRYQSRAFVFVNTTAYKTYKLEITKNLNNVALTQLAEIELKGCDGFIEGIDYVYDSTNGWSPNDPNGVSYTEDTITVNDGEVVFSTSTICKDLTINPGSAVTINPGVTLTTENTTLNSTSQLYSSLIVDGTLNGTVKYKRYVNANDGGNDLIAPPLSGESWTDFLLSDTNASDIYNDGNNNPRRFLFGPFDKTIDDYVLYTDALSTTLVSGTGYRVATVSGTTLTFTGEIPTGTHQVNILNTGANYPDWNLIGNPYPSYIDMEMFLNYVIDPNTNPVTTNLSILENISGIYGYAGNGTSNKWTVITLANASQQLMTPGQGFFVAANAAYVDAYDIVFHPSMRTHGTDDDFIVGRNSSPLIYLKLKASTSNMDYGTEFYFNENASVGNDNGYDGKILGNVAPNFAIYSHLVEDNTGLPIALQALNPSDLINTVVPLGVNANQSEQLTFSISESTLPSDIEVYLEDTVENTVTLLNVENYTLTPNVPLHGVGRFYLRFSSSTLSVSNNEMDGLSIYTTFTPKSLVIKGTLPVGASISLYDIHGRTIFTMPLAEHRIMSTIDISFIETGIYFAKVSNGVNSKTKRVIIK